MLMTVKEGNRSLYEKACAFERVMGSRNLCALECYGEFHPKNRFLLGQLITGEPTAALYLSDSSLTISAGEQADPREIIDFIVHNGVKTVESNLELASGIQALIGGEMDSSCFMAFPHREPPEGDFSAVLPFQRLEDVFMVLQQSHEYYRTHFRYGAWAADAKIRLRQGALEFYQLNVDDEPAGTGSIGSRDDECGVLAALAVVPERRGKGWGALLAKFLTCRILAMGKTPRLLCGYDGAADFYRKIGYVETGRWGKLYL